MGAAIDVIELQAVYGFEKPNVFDLETIDDSWLENHCDVVGYARSKLEIPSGYWLERGYVVEIADTRLVARRDERAVRTLDGPIVLCFTRFDRSTPPMLWEWADAAEPLMGQRPSARPQSLRRDVRTSNECDLSMGISRAIPVRQSEARSEGPLPRETSETSKCHAGETLDLDCWRTANVNSSMSVGRQCHE